MTLIPNPNSISYADINQQLPILLNDLVSATPYNLEYLTSGTITSIFKSQNHPVGDVPGVYLISTILEDTPLYVGRSKKLAQRIGKDHRATVKSQATFSHRVLKSNIAGVTCMTTARTHIYNNFHIRMIAIEDVYTRTIFEVYAAMQLSTPHNSFMEH